MSAQLHLILCRTISTTTPHPYDVIVVQASVSLLYLSGRLDCSFPNCRSITKTMEPLQPPEEDVDLLLHVLKGQEK